MGPMLEIVGRLIARLQKPANCESFTPNDLTGLRETLRPGDVLLVEGKGRISGSIKYLTQSTWSHSALYVGPMAGAATEGEPHVLIEANIDEGVVSAPLSKYLHCQTRICRPVGLSEADSEKVCRYASERIGFGYDFKNVIDLMRYLFPWPVTQRWRRRTIALGSGDASRIICSSLIAQAFDAVRYPILPKITRLESQTAPREIAEIRHRAKFHGHGTDTDISRAKLQTPRHSNIGSTSANSGRGRFGSSVATPRTMPPMAHTSFKPALISQRGTRVCSRSTPFTAMSEIPCRSHSPREAMTPMGCRYPRSCRSRSRRRSPTIAP